MKDKTAILTMREKMLASWITESNSCARSFMHRLLQLGGRWYLFDSPIAVAVRTKRTERLVNWVPSMSG